MVVYVLYHQEFHVIDIYMHKEHAEAERDRLKDDYRANGLILEVGEFPLNMGR